MFDVDRAVEAYTNRLYYQTYEMHDNEYCRTCRYYDGGYCERLLDDIPIEAEDLSEASREPDDTCDDWSADDTYPDFLDGD